MENNPKNEKVTIKLNKERVARHMLEARFKIKKFSDRYAFFCGLSTSICLALSLKKIYEHAVNSDQGYMATSTLLLITYCVHKVYRNASKGFRPHIYALFRTIASKVLENDSETQITKEEINMAMQDDEVKKIIIKYTEDTIKDIDANYLRYTVGCTMVFLFMEYCPNFLSRLDDFCKTFQDNVTNMFFSDNKNLPNDEANDTQHHVGNFSSDKPAL